MSIKRHKEHCFGCLSLGPNQYEGVLLHYIPGQAATICPIVHVFTAKSAKLLEHIAETLSDNDESRYVLMLEAQSKQMSESTERTALIDVYLRDLMDHRATPPIMRINPFDPSHEYEEIF